MKSQRNWTASFLVASLLAAPLVLARTNAAIELDLDGVLGNGPDTIEAFIGEDVRLDLWWVGDLPSPRIMVAASTVCSPGDALVYVATEYHLPAYWESYPPDFPSPGCVSLATYTINWFGCIEWPFCHATITFRAAAEGSIAELASDVAGSVLMTCTSWTYYYAAWPSKAYVRIGSTETESSSWGSLKRLFK
ncbi:MAG: hypothetical protein FJY73_06875 [Candidatus Eisenbacteria bacterium]|nr:hypothetical protein [Candidatus Eisenbacteria bacterium]